jgi:hypothetical protein
MVLKNDRSYEFKTKVNLGDYVIYNVYDSVRDGYVRAITERGINVSTPWGNKFYKWCHIKEVHKKEEN